jgi:hypothetical protein
MPILELSPEEREGMKASTGHGPESLIAGGKLFEPHGLLRKPTLEVANDQCKGLPDSFSIRVYPTPTAFVSQKSKSKLSELRL